MRTVIIYGPQGCGKSTMAEEFQKFFGCKTVVDEPAAATPICEGYLYLTSRRLQDLPLIRGVEIFSYDEARCLMRDAK